MMQQEDDGWEDVTDPAEIKKLLGVKGVQDMVTQAKTANGGSTDPTITAPSGLKAAQLGGWAKARASMETIAALNKLRKNYDTNFSNSGPSAIAEYFPSQKNAALDAQVAALLNPAKAASRSAGEGAFSDKDLESLQASLPSRWKFDGGNQQAMRDLDGQLRGHIRTGFGAAGLPAEDILRASEMNAYDPAAAGPMDAESRNTMLDQMVAQGRTPQEIMDFLKESGSDPAAVDAQKDAITADRNYRFANPGKPAGPAITIPNAPPSATQSPPRPDAAAIKAKYGIQ